MFNLRALRVSEAAGRRTPNFPSFQRGAVDQARRFYTSRGMREFAWDCPMCGEKNVIKTDGDHSLHFHCTSCGRDLDGSGAELDPKEKPKN